MTEASINTSLHHYCPSTQQPKPEWPALGQQRQNKCRGKASQTFRSAAKASSIRTTTNYYKSLNRIHIHNTQDTLLLPLVSAQPNNVSLFDNPILGRCVSITCRRRRSNCRPRNDGLILTYKPLLAPEHGKALAVAVAYPAPTNPVLRPLSQLIQVSDNALKHRRLGLFPADNHPGPQDNGVLEIKLLDGILDNTNLHLRVRQVARGKAPSAAARDEHVRLDARLLGRSGVLDAQVVVNLPLVLDAARRGSRRAHGVEDHARLGGKRGHRAAPFGGVCLFESLELGRLRAGGSSGNGLYGRECVCGQERGEDLRAHGAGGPEHGGRRHGSYLMLRFAGVVRGRSWAKLGDFGRAA
ncbi:hypothetical protein MAJ_10929, partial [Metarhizium majus ARSEF 297]